MNGQGHTDHTGPPLPRAIPAFEERAGVPTWTVPGINGTAVIEVLDDGQVGVVSACRFDEAGQRGFAQALQAAWSRAAA